MSRTRTLVVATGLLIASMPLAAQGRGHAKSSSPPAKTTHAPAPGRTVRATERISSDEIRAIHDYYRTDRDRAKPIPPGIFRNLVRGKPLPPGIERTRIPDDLNSRLYARRGYTWYVAGDRLLLVDPNGRLASIVRMW